MRTGEERAGAADPVPRPAAAGLVAAVGVATVGAVAVIAAPLIGVAGSASDGVERGSVAAAVTVGVMLLGVVVLAAEFLRRPRLRITTGLLVGVGAVAVGAAALDLQLFVRALDANRLELFRPTTIAELPPGPGAWLVLLGHLALVAAGVWAAVLTRRLEDDAPEGDVPVGTRIGSWLTSATVVVAVVLAVSLLLTPIISRDPVLVVPAVVQSGAAVAVGSAAVAVAVLLVVALALVSTSPAWAAGTMAGAAVAVASVQLPRLLGAATDPGTSPGLGSALGSAAALVLGVLAVVVVAVDRRPREPGPQPSRTLPPAASLQRGAAAVGAVAGVLAVAGALTAPLSAGDLELPGIPQTRVLLVAGLVAVLACALLGATQDVTVRPAATVVLLGLVLGAAALLQAVLVVAGVTGVPWGPGAILALLSVVVATAGAALAGLAGAVERDDVDLTELPDAPDRVRALLGAGGFAAVAGLLLPLYTAPGRTPPGPFSAGPGAWGWDTWSLVLVAAALGVTVLVALRARPVRGASLLVGAVLVLAVHLAGWPLTSGRVAGAGPGPGAVLTVLAIVTLTAAAVVLARSSPARPLS